MKIADLTGALLDYWVARAEGIPAEQLEIRGVPRTDQCICVRKLPDQGGRAGAALEVLAYSTNWRQGGPLIEKHMLELENLADPVRWSARFWDGSRMLDEYGDAPLIAICRALVFSVFGEEVEDLPCE